MPKPTPPPKPKAPAAAEPTASTQPARLPGQPTEGQIMDTMVKRSISREEAVSFLSQPPVEQDVKRRMAAGLTREQAEQASANQVAWDAQNSPTEKPTQEPAEVVLASAADPAWLSEALIAATQADQRIGRIEAIHMLKAGYVLPAEIAEKMKAGLSREFAIQAVIAQRTDDRRKWEAEKSASTRVDIDKQTPSRFAQAAMDKFSATLKS